MEKCAFHDEAMQMFRDDLRRGSEEFRLTREKLDKIIEGQTQQAIKIQELHSTVHNGLKADTSKTAQCVVSLEARINTVCHDYEEKFKEIDDFRWFRVWANSLRDNAIKKFLTSAFIGGMIISVIFFIAYGSEKFARWFN